MSRKAKDLTGQKFGMLTVKHRGEDVIRNNKRRITWICDCDCGNKNVVCLADSLTAGYKKSCGCLQHRPQHDDLLGMKFGRLEVVAFDGIKNGKAYWLCKCECGNEKYVKVSTNDLKAGNTQSCGCLRNERVKEAVGKPNKYDLSGEYGIGYCNNINKIGLNEFYFDLDDYDLIKDYHWFFDKDGYVVGYKNSNDKYIPLHRLILGIENKTQWEIIGDHIHHIPHDNRKDKIRDGTRSQNAMNVPKRNNNTSGITGVYYDKARLKWHSQIGIDNKNINLGRYDTYEDAINARKQAEEKYFGKWSYDNSISE